MASADALTEGVSRLLIDRGYKLRRVVKVESSVDEGGMATINAIWMDTSDELMHVEIVLDHVMQRELVWVTQP